MEDKATPLVQPMLTLLHVTFKDRSSRDDICRDRCDRWSRKNFVDCVNFSVDNASCEQNLPKSTHIAYVLQSLFLKFLRKMSNECQFFHIALILRKALVKFTHIA